MVGLPPGTILQLMYLQKRVRRLSGRFIEIGPGAGEITKLLLELGWQGTAYDLDGQTISHLQQRFRDEIVSGRLSVVHGDFVALGADQPADLVVSCMVMEHMDEPSESRYLAAARASLNPGGRLIGLVPGSPEHWGIEDEIAGHCRRYTRVGLRALARQHGRTIEHLTGLTYPVSNLLLPISNWLVKRSEESKLTLSAVERTKESGRRHVAFKTQFPRPLALFLNQWTMLPFYWIQRLFGDVDSALVLYFEAVPSDAVVDGRAS